MKLTSPRPFKAGIQTFVSKQAKAVSLYFFSFVTKVTESKQPYNPWIEITTVAVIDCCTSFASPHKPKVVEHSHSLPLLAVI